MLKLQGSCWSVQVESLKMIRKGGGFPNGAELAGLAGIGWEDLYTTKSAPDASKTVKAYEYESLHALIK